MSRMLRNSWSTGVLVVVALAVLLQTNVIDYGARVSGTGEAIIGVDTGSHFSSRIDRQRQRIAKASPFSASANRPVKQLITPAEEDPAFSTAPSPHTHSRRTAPGRSSHVDAHYGGSRTYQRSHLYCVYRL